MYMGAAAAAAATAAVSRSDAAAVALTAAGLQKRPAQLSATVFYMAAVCGSYL
jgi:hypothetical protein